MNNTFIQEQRLGRRQERAEAIASEEQRVPNAIAAIAASDSGKIFLRHLLAQCGMYRVSASQDPITGELNPHAGMYNEGRRSIWVDLRDLIPYDSLRDIEVPPPSARPTSINTSEI